MTADSAASEYDAEMRSFVDDLLAFETTPGSEGPAVEWLDGRLDDLGFDTYRWAADAARLAEHPSFPDDPADIDVVDRPSVGGVLEFGDPDAGKTLVLMGHVDVVPAEAENWSSPPFEPTWHETDEGAELVARGAADMKSGVATAVFAALAAAERAEASGLDGRIVVEGVAGEEEGGIGAAAAAMDNPYPFERDAAVVTEPTELRPVVATEGSVMKRLELTGRSAHAATAWRGEDVLPRFEAIRRAFETLEQERHDDVTHPLYDDYPSRWPVVFGTVRAGNWASTVPESLVAEVRIGVAPGETVDEVEAQFEDRLAEVVADDEWLAAHPPTFERFSVQFEPSEIDPDEPVVDAVQDAMDALGCPGTEPEGVTYGADARHYIEAGIPTVIFGAGSIDQAHFPDETIQWDDVLTAVDVLADATRRYLSSA
ncbi:M20/M25/M40 family metallo-hydrolase [Halospeciosus flavus]|uniref:M20/M25/M40 family metallo-hydrolase n=1 Tax=Halospeciosus flavus TaxID=3032283 RepID=A0ABD5Z6V5_9EURY|nr:M20/M25/M40 family metallo-hydrolase [Halospeciosus flavus]